MNQGVSKRCTPLQRLWRGFCALLAFTCAGLICAPAAAQTASATAGSQAVVVEPLSLIKVADLNFGKIAARPTAGTVTVDPNTGACTVTGPILSVGGCHFAEFAGMGVRNMRVRFQIPTTVTLTGPGGATMVADTFTLGIAPDLIFIGGNGNGLGNGNKRYQIVSSTGIFTFRIGARLNVGANQAPGIYTGTFPVTVQYQ
ncbi:MAG TPA: DUF4402 domain-containing protein [Novosphingobium sp.]|nr:DUF4402 domain-containing protein [Novosphingobium sp.]